MAVKFYGYDLSIVYVEISQDEKVDTASDTFTALCGGDNPRPVF